MTYSFKVYPVAVSCRDRITLRTCLVRPKRVVFATVFSICIVCVAAVIDVVR